MTSSVIFGCEGKVLSDEERTFFRATDPWGFILFRRNCETREQITALCGELRDTVGREAPILVDHEGGRVSRLSSHIVPKRPPMAVFEGLGKPASLKAVRLGAELLARDAADVGITVNCVPMVDVRQPGAHDIVGDRAFSTSPETVAALGQAMIEGTLAGGCLPIIKHIPGHGRAMADSHLELPRVEASHGALSQCDFVPFKALAHAPLAMTAHIVYEALDDKEPATTSVTVIEDIIRKEIGFQGLLMTDDLSMKALKGSFYERSVKSLKAGCDLLLHCNGDMTEMEAVAGAAIPLSAEAERRSEKALTLLTPPAPAEKKSLEEEFASLTNGVNIS
ncbi:MAG: beta-N-acetylhexosaminidase [Pseudomonadota bacterium]